MKNSFCLANLKRGESGIILRFDEVINQKIKGRLLELGFVFGQKVTLEQISVFGDVMLFSLRGYEMSLRKDIAKHIMCKEVDNA